MSQDRIGRMLSLSFGVNIDFFICIEGGSDCLCTVEKRTDDYM